MSTSSTKQYGFSDPNFDWELYARARPVYPESLWDTILSYHKGSFDKALELGSGYGIGTKDFLAKKFRHVWTTDPVEYNLDAARAFLKDEISEGRVRTVQAGAEDRVLEKGEQVDIVLALQCLHWADPGRFIPSIAAQLKSGGTFAAVFYTNVSIVGNRRANEAWVMAFSKTMRKWERKPGHERLAQAWDGLDSTIPLPGQFFEPGVRRVRLNAGVLEEVGHRRTETPFRLFGGHGEGAGDSYVKDEDVVESGESDEWTKEVDKKWLRETILSFQAGTEEVEEELREVESALDEGSGGRAKVRWVVDIVLATRK